MEAIRTDYKEQETGGLVVENAESNNDNLILIKSKTVCQNCAIPENIRKEKQQDAPDMADLFKQTLEQQGQYQPEKFNWIDDNTIEISDLSGMALHSFLLQAEAHGKKVTYTTQTRIEISNQ